MKIKAIESVFRKLCFMIGFLMLLSSCSGESQTQTENQDTEEETTEVQEPEEPVIEYTTLREWNPDDESRALGLDILINEDDATKSNIENLIISLANDTEKVVIRVYQSREVWQEAQSGNFTDAYDRGYLAHFVRNLTNSGAYRGSNEIRWFQADGQLEHLMGTNTQL